MADFSPRILLMIIAC